MNCPVTMMINIWWHHLWTRLHCFIVTQRRRPSRTLIIPPALWHIIAQYKLEKELSLRHTHSAVIARTSDKTYFDMMLTRRRHVRHFSHSLHVHHRILTRKSASHKALFYVHRRLNIYLRSKSIRISLHEFLLSSNIDFHGFSCKERESKSVGNIRAPFNCHRDGLMGNERTDRDKRRSSHYFSTFPPRLSSHFVFVGREDSMIFICSTSTLHSAILLRFASRNLKLKMKLPFEWLRKRWIGIIFKLFTHKWFLHISEMVFGRWHSWLSHHDTKAHQKLFHVRRW